MLPLQSDSPKAEKLGSCATNLFMEVVEQKRCIHNTLFSLLLRVSRRHVARQSSHISDTLVFFKCLSAMCTRWFPKGTDQQVSYEFQPVTLKYLDDCSIVQVNQLRLRVPESSQKLGLLLKVSRRHIARQSSHISDTLVLLKCLSAMCTKWFPKKE